MRKCVTCEYWKGTAQWRGNCPLHPFPKDKYDEDAEHPDCPDYVDKYAKYQIAQEVK